MSSLRLVANLWTLIGHPHPSHEWTIKQKIAAIKEAGFDALTGELDGHTVALAHEAGLDCVGFFWATDGETIARETRRHREMGVEKLTVFLGRHDTPLDELLALALALEKAGSTHGLHLAPETHRGTGTETPEKTTALLAAFRHKTGRELMLTWDFSHHALVKHLTRKDWSERLLAEQENICQSQLFHFRPFNGQHAQLPVRVAEQKIPEYLEFLDFVQEVLDLWKNAPENAERLLWVCPEIGPKVSGYTLSHEPAPWEQAVHLAQDLRALSIKSGQ